MKNHISLTAVSLFRNCLYLAICALFSFQSYPVKADLIWNGNITTSFPTYHWNSLTSNGVQWQWYTSGSNFTTETDFSNQVCWVQDARTVGTLKSFTNASTLNEITTGNQTSFNGKALYVGLNNVELESGASYFTTVQKRLSIYGTDNTYSVSLDKVTLGYAYIDPRKSNNKTTITGTLTIAADPNTDNTFRSKIICSSSGNNRHLIVNSNIVTSEGSKLEIVSYGASTVGGDIIELNGVISGAGKIKLSAAGSVANTIKLTSSNPDFNGTWIINSNSSEYPVLVTGDLGTGSVEIVQGVLQLQNANNALTLYNLSGTGEVKAVTESAFNLTIHNTEGTSSLYRGKINVGATGKITKTGTGTLQLYNEVDQAIVAGQLFVNSGRLDLKGYLTSSLEVAELGTFSPGNSIGTADVTKTLFDSGTLLIEVSGTENDLLNVGSIEFLNNAEISIVDVGGALVPNRSFMFLTSNMVLDDTFDWDSLLTSESAYYWNLSLSNGNRELWATVNNAAVPEPSTWMLLILGTVGLMLFRRRQ